jgi:preprotein translocase subunit SecE
MPVAEKENKTIAKAAAAPGGLGQSLNPAGFITRSRNFIDDVRSEMRKVVTPSREEVQNTTIVVIASVFLFAAFFFAVDSVLGAALKALIHSLGGTQ